MIDRLIAGLIFTLIVVMMIIMFSGCAGSRLSTPFLYIQARLGEINERNQAKGYWHETKWVYQVTFTDQVLRDCYGDLNRQAPEVVFMPTGQTRYLPQWDQVVFNPKETMYRELVHEYTHALTLNPSGHDFEPLNRVPDYCIRESLAQAMVKISRLLDEVEYHKARRKKPGDRVR